MQEEYLDEDEQQELLASLQQIQHQQAWRMRLFVFMLSLLCTTGHLWLAVQQALHPWGLKHHAHFYGEASSQRKVSRTQDFNTDAQISASGSNEAYCKQVQSCT